MTIYQKGSDFREEYRLINELPSKKIDSQKRKLAQACADFESVFYKMMLDSMRESLNKNSLFPKTPATDLYEDMLYDRYAKEMSRDSGTDGIGATLYEQVAQIGGMDTNTNFFA